MIHTDSDLDQFEIDEALPLTGDPDLWEYSDTSTGYKRTIHCKLCPATIQVSTATWSDQDSYLRAAGWSCVLKDSILTKTLCPTCSEPPPQVPDHVLQTLLVTLETSVEEGSRKRTKLLRDARDNRVRSLKNWDENRSARGYISAIEQCSEQYALYSLDGALVVHPIRCRKRACPICEAARMDKWRARLRPLVKAFSAPKHIVLTLRSSPADLDVQLDRLVHSFRRLRQRNLWKRRSPWGMFFIEITYNENSGLWHPHLHIIANMPFLAFEALKEAWLEITGDSQGVYVEAVHNDIIGEISKYIAKASTIFQSPVDPFAVNAVLKGRRLIQPFGSWPKLPKLPPQKIKFIATVADLVFRARTGDRIAIAYCSIIRTRDPAALYAACVLPRPPDLPARIPKRAPCPPHDSVSQSI